MNELVFLFIAASACTFALLTVIAHDVFHAAVWLALTLLSIAGIYFYLDAEFLGVVQVLVYVGGIMTLFIFAIKLTSKIGDKTIRQTNGQNLVAGVLCLILFFIIFKILNANPWTTESEQVISLKELGHSLITNYALPFEFISLLLLAAMVGAIVIGKVKK